MEKVLLTMTISVLMSFGITSVANADDLTKRIGIGLGNPYISIKYGFNSKCSIEAKGAFGSGITVGGTRFYHNFNPNDRTVIFMGVEGNHVSFDTNDISGNGWIGYGFVGGEYFISQKFTFNLDIGPAFISLEEDECGLSIDGVEWVFNLGVNFYLK